MKERRTLKPYWILIVIVVGALGLALTIPVLAQVQQHAESEAAQTSTGATINVTTTNDELNSDNDCSLREAVQAANTDSAVDACTAGDGWDTIRVPAGTYRLTLTGAGENSNATGDLDVLESVNITGAGSNSTIFDGMVSDRVLHVDPANNGVTLDLQDVTISNGFSSSGGGMRVVNGVTIIRGSTLSDNSADDEGGAIYIDDGSLHLIDSTIQYNNVVSGTSSYGGGIFNDEAVVNLKNTTVSHNSAYDGAGIYAANGSVNLDATKVVSNQIYTNPARITYGGGIYADNGHLWIGNGSEIAYNQSPSRGGGIYGGDNALVTMSDSWLHHNQSSDYGGGLYADSSGTTIKNSVIEYNSADYDEFGEGGGIYHEYDLILENSTLAHNDAYEGGGIYQEYGTLIISNTTVYSNTAYEGGAVYQYAYGGTFAVRSIFEENNAENEGGAIYMYDEGGVYVEDSAFLNNHADYGGAIMVYEESGLNIVSSTFSGNGATTDGGALYLNDSAAAEIRNSTFSDNHADRDGGAIYSYDYPAADIQFVTIVSNSAGNSGGGIYSDYHVAPQNSIIAGNSAKGSVTDSYADCSTDGVFLSGGNNLLGENTGCEATRYDDTVPNGVVFTTVLGPLTDNGGGLLPDGTHPQTHALLSSSPAIDAANDNFCLETDQTGTERKQGNACDQGAYESNYSATVSSPAHNQITVTTTNDELNSDNDCSLREAVQAANTDSAVDNCAAGDGWDVIQLPAGTYRLTIAGSGEGANQTGDLNVLDFLTIRGQNAGSTIIDGNDLDRVLDLNESVLRVIDATVSNGDSPGYGGCIQNSYGYFTVMDSIISHCESTSYGGGIFNDQGVMRIQDSLITENYSNSENGGAYNYYGVATIQNSQVISNSGLAYGGGVMSYVGTTRIDGSSILSNTVRSFSGGGGVYHDYGNLIIENGTEVRYNESASKAGGVLAEDGAIIIKDSFITHNHSVREGGGLYADAGIWVINTDISYNKTDSDGGGVYGNGYLQHNTIQYNEAIDYSGGGLYTWGILLDNLVSGNKADRGAGIYAEGVILYNTQIASNLSQGHEGAGLYLTDGGAYMVDSSVEDNIGYAGQKGAGIYSDATDAAVVARNSTINNNRGASEGGGIYAHGVVDLLNTTVSGNEADTGGGIYAGDTTVAINYSAIADNIASSNGGGIANDGFLTLMNSIVAGNKANGSATDSYADCSPDSPITFAGYGLFGDGTGCAANGRSDQKVDPQSVFTSELEPLADNGGDTQTHALLNGSSAVDAADDDFCPSIDQRGYTRPSGSGCDIGAYEQQANLIFLPVIFK